MHYKELDELLMKEFCEKVEALQPSQLHNASAIRVLADIASVLNCLWHPAMQKHYADRQPASKSYFDTAMPEPTNPY